MGKKQLILRALILVSVFLVFIPVSSSSEPLQVLYFYDDECDECNAFKPILDDLEAEYGTLIEVVRYSAFDEWDLYTSNGFTKIPALVIGDSKIQYDADLFTEEYISRS